MKRAEDILSVTCECTGGGYYLYTGLIGSGEYYMTATDWGTDVIIVDVNPDEYVDDNGFDWWQNEHTICELVGSEGEEFWGRMLEELENHGGDYGKSLAAYERKRISNN